MTVFLKSTFRPLASVKWPSSRTCNKILKTSGWAFSTSSNRITEYGFWRIFSVNWPPSSYPTYPGGEPIKRLVLYFSINSDISTRTNASSLPNMASASALASSVFPTPVGPKNINEPIGRFGSFNPLLDRLIALETDSTACSCPITRLCNIFSKFINRSDSFCSICWTGILVQRETTSAISLSVTCNDFNEAFPSCFCSKFSIFLRCFISFIRILAAFSKSCNCIASSLVCIKASNSATAAATGEGLPETSKRTLEADSSIKSIALSGNCLDVI